MCLYEVKSFKSKFWEFEFNPRTLTRINESDFQNELFVLKE